MAAILHRGRWVNRDEFCCFLYQISAVILLRKHDYEHVMFLFMKKYYGMESLCCMHVVKVYNKNQGSIFSCYE